MADNFSFRSSINGFNRNDVMIYIESVLREKAELSVRVAALEKEIADIKENCVNDVNTCKEEALNSKKDSEDTISRLEGEIASLKADNDALKEQVTVLTEKYEGRELEFASEKRAFAAREAELANELECARSNEAVLIKEKEDAIVVLNEKCATCDIAKVCEARLGAAMLDAKRFSELLVKEANDKAAKLFADAYSTAKTTSDKAGAISQNIAEISKQLDGSFKNILDNMVSLGKNLDSFKADVKLSGEKFDFTTDFVALSNAEPDVEINSESVKDLIHKNESSTKNVNFDDADEFDFKVDAND